MLMDKPYEVDQKVPSIVVTKNVLMDRKLNYPCFENELNGSSETLSHLSIALSCSALSFVL